MPTVTGTKISSLNLRDSSVNVSAFLPIVDNVSGLKTFRITLQSIFDKLTATVNVGDFTNDAGYLTTETDPVWISEKGDYYTSAQVDGLPVSTFTNDSGYLTIETDPVWTAEKVDYYTSVQVDALPISTFTNDSGYLTTETDPVWTAEKGDYYTSAQVNALPVSTFTNDAGYLTSNPSYAATDISFSSYLTITSANVQLAIEELKDELDVHTGNETNPHNTSASDVGLGSVENVALSTWPGSTNITTLGTVTTGVWNGSIIEAAYLEDTFSVTNESNDRILTSTGSGTANAEENITFDGSTLTLAADLDFSGANHNITNMGDVIFQTGATGGTIQTGTSNADKWQLQAYDVDGSAHQTVASAHAGNTVLFHLFSNSLRFTDASDNTKRASFDLSGITTGTTRAFTFPDQAGTFALTSDLSGGDVTGPGSSTDNTIPRFDGTSGKIIQGSSVEIDDNDNIDTNGGSLTAGALSATDDVAFGTNGFYWDETRRQVGIGTNSLTRTLEVTEPGQAEIRLFTNDAINVLFIMDTNADGTPRSGVMGVDHSDNLLRINHGSIFDGTHNGIEINSSGNVGVSGTLTSGQITSTALEGTGTRLMNVTSGGAHGAIANGSNGQVMTMVSGSPAWGDIIDSGEWTATSSNLSNVSSVVISGEKYIRVGSMVTFSFRASFDIDTSGSNSFEVSLPIASNWGFTADVTATVSSNDSKFDRGIAEAGPAIDDEILVTFTTNSTGAAVVNVSGQYEIK